MRFGTAQILACAFLAGAGFPIRAASDESVPANSREKYPRGPYILREIFGDAPQSVPTVWSIVPGMRRHEIPPKADLGREVAGSDAPASSVREIGGRANVTFVFDGREPDSRLDHITATVFESPGVTRKSVFTHLCKIYGAPDPEPRGETAETAGSWLKGAVLMRHFSASRFFEVILSVPRQPS